MRRQFSDNRRTTAAVGAALAAGVVAAGVAYLLFLRPQWRRHVVEIGHHLLEVAEGMVKRSSLDSRKD